MKVVVVIFFVLILSICALAQGGATLTGTIYHNGQPVPDTDVELRPSKNPTQAAKAKSDANGVYRFDNLAPDTYQIIARKLTPPSRPDHDPTIIGEAFNRVRITMGSRKTVDLWLNLDRLSSQLPIREYVTVSADASQPIEQVSKTVDVIDGQEMRDRADFALVETLRTIPGFRVQQLGGFGRTANIKTRGLRNQDTAILIDGIRFRDASAITGDASAFLSDFTLTSVSKVEVLRGSGSSLYGTNAIGGTIDFQTARLTPGFHGQLSTAIGGLGLRRFRANLSDGTANGKFGFTMGVSRTAYTKGIDGNDNAHNTNFQSRIEYTPTEKTNLSARFFVSDAYVRLNSSPDTLGTPPASNFGVITANPGVNFVFDRDDPDSTQKSKFFNGQFVLTHEFTDELLFEGSYSGLKTSRKNENGPLGVPFQSASTSFFDGTIHTANAHLIWAPSSINRLTAGYEFEHEKFGNDGRTPSGFGNFFTRAFQSSHTFYAQNLVQLFGRRLQLAGGFRAQFFDLKQPEFSAINAPYSNRTTGNPPNAYTFDGAASYYFENTGTKLRAHVGNGYRVPSLFERFGTFFSTFGINPGFVALGDPNLKPERTIAFDAGVEQNLFNDRAKLSATYFYTKLIETIGFGNSVRVIPGTPRPFGGYLNTEGGIARGAEFSAKLRPFSTTDIFASYTFTNSDQQVQQVTGSGVIQTLGIPANQFTLVATQRFGRFWANVDFLATSSYLAPIFSGTTFNSYVYSFKGNRRADLTAGYTFPLKKDRITLRLFGTVENLFDYEYYENGFRTVGRNARIGLALSF